MATQTLFQNRLWHVVTLHQEIDNQYALLMECASCYVDDDLSEGNQFYFHILNLIWVLRYISSG